MPSIDERKKLADPEGFEPPVYSLEGCRPILLGYGSLEPPYLSFLTFTTSIRRMGQIFFALL